VGIPVEPTAQPRAPRERSKEPTLLTHASRHAPGDAVLMALLTALLTALSLTVLSAPPFADSASAATGCVSRAEYRRLAQGQLLSYIRRVAGDDAQISMRRWSQNGSRYQERRYAMCRPLYANNDTLTTRFTIYRGAWRAYLVDTHVGPDK
jgi:hypothetical protein